MIVQGVWDSMSSGEKRWRVLPFLVRGFMGCMEEDRLEWMWEEREVWILDPVVLFFVDDDVPGKAVEGCDEIIEDTASTFPSLAMRMSSRASWFISGWRDSSIASFMSVDSSSAEDATGDSRLGLSRGLFLETNASICSKSHGSLRGPEMYAEDVDGQEENY